MTKSIQLTSADSASHNLYGLILAALAVTQLPQRVDLGAVVFPDFVSSVNFSVASGTWKVLDSSGNLMTSINSGNTSFGNGNINNISLQAMQLQADAGSRVINITAFQV